MIELAGGGRGSDRPELRRALDRVRALAPGSALLVVRLDRLARSLLDYASLAADAEREGWTILALDAPDRSTPSGRALSGMLAVFAELERDLIRARIRAALAERRARGLRPAGPAPRPWPPAADRLIRAESRRGANAATIAAALERRLGPSPRWHPRAVRRRAQALGLPTGPEGGRRRRRVAASAPRPHDTGAPSPGPSMARTTAIYREPGGLRVLDGGREP